MEAENETKEKQTRQYELGYILPPNFGEGELLSALQKLSTYLGEISAKTLKEGSPVKKLLPHPITKLKQGYFGFILFETDPEKLTDLEKKLKMEKNILRYWVLQPTTKTKRRVVKQLKPAFPKIQEGTTEKISKEPPKEPRVKLEEIDHKLEEILGE